MLQNRFYLGELPDSDGWIPGVHEPVLDDESFERAQQARTGNRKAGALSVTRTRRVHSLSGLATCGHCGGRLHVATDRHGKARIYSYQSRHGTRCPQRSVFLEIIEHQLGDYLAAFHLLDDTVTEVIRLHEEASDQRDDAERRRHEITSRLERMREMYKWGDLTREAYLAGRNRLEHELAGLGEAVNPAQLVVQAAAFLRDFPAAWQRASPEQRSALAPRLSIDRDSR